MWGKPAEVQVLDPTKSGEAVSWQVLDLVYESLVSIDENLKPVPVLAESWEQTSPTTYVFTIRKGVKFSNGRPMTVDDVVGSLKRLIDPKTASWLASQLGEVRSVAEDGPWRVKVTLAQPRAAFLASLASVSAAVLPMQELRSGEFDPSKELLGTGPFKVAGHSQDESWTLAKNSHYWREGEPKVDSLVIRIMPEDATRVAALRDGSVDVATFATPDAVQLLNGQPNIKTVVQDTTDYYRLDVNAITSAFRDDRLREALSLAIDRKKIVELALGGVGQPSAASPSGLGSTCDPANVPFAEPDVERARELVEEAGATGKKVSIIAAPQYKTFPLIAQVLQQSLEQTGLKVEILQLDTGEWFKRVFQDPKAPFDMSLSFFAGFADPAMVLTYWNPKNAPAFAPWLKSDPELNELIDQTVRGPVDAARDEAIGEICNRVAEDANIIPLVSNPSIIGYRSDQVTGIDIPKLEGYAIPLRNIRAFTVN